MFPFCTADKTRFAHANIYLHYHSQTTVYIAEVALTCEWEDKHICDIPILHVHVVI